MGSQNLKEGDYLAEKANKYLFPSVKKLEHHTELSKWMVEMHSTHLGIQLYKGEKLGVWRVLTVQLMLLQLLMATVQYFQTDHYCLIPERSN